MQSNCVNCASVQIRFTQKFFYVLSKARANSDDQLPVVEILLNGTPVNSAKSFLDKKFSHSGITSSLYDSGDESSISSYPEINQSYNSKNSNRGITIITECY